MAEARSAGVTASCTSSGTTSVPATTAATAGEPEVRILYVATRYANGHPEGAPFEHYGRIQSQDAIDYADEILAFVEKGLSAE